MKTKKGFRGFTLIEVLVVVGVIAVVGSAGYVTATNVQESARQNKLQSDVSQVNSALQLYKANGGQLPSSPNATNIVAKLKTKAPDATALKSIGLKGSFLDTRVTPVMQTDQEAASTQTRAIWNNATGSFEIATSGAKGIKKFILDDAAAAAGPSQDADRKNNLTAAVRDKWVWDFEDKTADSAAALNGPNQGSPTTYSPATASSTSKLATPTISPATSNRSIIEYPLEVTIRDNVNPPGTAQIYYTTYSSTGGSAGTPQLYRTSLFVQPDTIVDAYAYSIDPDRYENSDHKIETLGFTAAPLAPSLTQAGPLTYATAGGLMANGSQAAIPTMSLTLPVVAPPYFSNSTVAVTYAVNGVSYTYGSAFSSALSVPIAIGPPSLWTNSTLVVTASAGPQGSPRYYSPGTASQTVSISKLALNLVFAPTSAAAMAATDTITISPASTANFPNTYSIYYTTDGSEPDRSKTLYTGSFSLGSGVSNAQLRAKAFPTSAADEKWFNMFTATAGPYTVPVASSDLPSGVLISLAELQNSVQLNGSMTVAWTGAASNITLFGSSMINGNVYVPGTPSVYKDHIAESQWDFQKWTGTTDGNFANYILGKQYTATGTLANPQTQPVSPRVVDLDGDAEPSNYTFLIQDSAKIGGKLYRRSTKITLPTVSQPGTKSNNETRQYNSWTLNGANPNAYSATVNPSVNANLTLTTSSTLTLMSGNYGTVSASSNGRLVLGDAGNPNNVQYYTFESLQVNGGASIDIVGKVVITVNYSVGGQTTRIDNSGYIGNSAHPEYLQFNVYSNAAPNANAQHFLVASSGKFYGRLNAPKGLVTIQEGGIFSGAVTAFKLQMTGAASTNVNFNLSPVSS